MAMDASQSGWGDTCGHQVLSSLWPLNCSLHINALELQALLLALKYWFPSLRGQVVVLNLDNRTAVAYILQEGGMCSAQLLEITRRLYTLAVHHPASLIPPWCGEHRGGCLVTPETHP